MAKAVLTLEEIINGVIITNDDIEILETEFQIEVFTHMKFMVANTSRGKRYARIIQATRFQVGYALSHSKESKYADHLQYDRKLDTVICDAAAMPHLRNLFDYFKWA